MTRPEAPIRAFRRRLLQLIDERFEGRYTALARRAGIPISTMQHYIHNAKHLPGGEHLMRIAAALGVTVQALIADRGPGQPTARPGPPIRVLQPQADRPVPAGLVIPVVHCGCPGACPLTAEGPLTPATGATIILPGELLPPHQAHRLLATPVGDRLPAAEWPTGTQLVVDVAAHTPTWDDLALIHTEGRCQVGHLTPVETALFFGAQRDGDFRVVMTGWRILGTVIAGIVPLAGHAIPPGQRTG